MHARLLIQLWEYGRRLNVDAASRVGVVLRNERDAFPPGRTDHFKLFKTLTQGKAGEFLGYRIA